VRTVAATGQGVDELAAEVAKHAAWLREKGGIATKRRQQAESELLDAAAERAVTGARASGGYQKAIDAVARREADPYTALGLL
jgi:LAO/AO transport system kinase